METNSQSLIGQASPPLWWLILLRGIPAIIIGILFFTNPGATLIVIMMFLGAYWLVDAIFTLIESIRAKFRVLVLLMIAILLSGTTFYSIVEKWNIIDSIYFCVMTIATIGYGDLAPSNPLSKIFTVVMVLSGIGVFVGIATKLAQTVTQEEIKKDISILLKIIEKRGKHITNRKKKLLQERFIFFTS